LRHARGDILLIGAVAKEDEVMPGFFKDWTNQRERKKIKLKFLFKEFTRGISEKKIGVYGKLFEKRFLPKEIESPAVINIYGDRVINVLWKNNKPLCFMLINKEIADSYRQYFNYLWSLSKP
jgi:hypothetical protein